MGHKQSRSVPGAAIATANLDDNGTSCQPVAAMETNNAAAAVSGTAHLLAAIRWKKLARQRRAAQRQSDKG